MDGKEFEQKLSQLLRLRFAGPNDPGLADRKKRLVSLFQSLSSPVLATIYHARLSTRNPHDELVKEFEHRLATATRDLLLQILLHNSGQPAPTAPASGPTSPRFRLIDEDHGGERWITQDAPEFLDRYIDFNIAQATSDPDPHTLTHHTMVVQYGNGRTLEFPLSAVPVRLRYFDPDNPGARIARIRFEITPDAYLLRKGLIFPVDHRSDVMFNDTFTPTLIDIRTAIEFNIRQRRTLLELAEVTAAFASSISFLGGFHASYSGGIGWTVRPRTGRTTAPNVSLQGKRPLDASYRVQKQYKKVTTIDLLKWMREGGHTLEKHNPHLTRENLKQRVMGKEAFIPAPQMERGGTKPADLRVWRGEKSPAASKWADQATMNKAIGDVIHKNLDNIRRTTIGGGEVVLEKQSLNYKTGEGWVTTAGPKQGVPKDQQSAFFDDKLTGATIVIRPRKNHVPTADDPEGWYVHTAYPDRAE